MRRSVLEIVVVAIVLIMSSGAARAMAPHLDIVAEGGFTLGSDAQEVSLSNGDMRGFQGQDVLGIESRVSALPWSSFVAVSYKVGGLLDVGDPEGFESFLKLRTQFIQVVVGRDVRLGAATLSLGLGYSYVTDRFTLKSGGRSLELHEERGSGGLLGARVLAPLVGPVSVLWDYQLLIRPSVAASGRLGSIATYGIRQGSVHHFVMGGLSIRVI